MRKRKSNPGVIKYDKDYIDSWDRSMPKLPFKYVIISIIVFVLFLSFLIHSQTDQRSFNVIELIKGVSLVLWMVLLVCGFIIGLSDGAWETVKLKSGYYKKKDHKRIIKRINMGTIVGMGSILFFLLTYWLIMRL